MLMPAHTSRALAAVGLSVAVLAGCSFSAGFEVKSNDPSSATAPDATVSDETGSDATDSDPAPDDPAAFVRAAAEKTINAPSFSIDSDLEVNLPTDDLAVITNGAGDYNNVIADLDLQVTSQTSEQRIELLADGDTMWMKTTDTGGQWVQGDADRLAGETFNQSGILGSLLMLRAAQDVEVGEASELDGVTGREYRTSFTYAEALAAAAPDEATFSYSFSLTGTGVDAVLNVTTWIGDDGVVRDFRFEIEHEAISGGADMKLRDVGQPIAPPEPPPSDETITGPEADQLLDQLLG